MLTCPVDEARAERHLARVASDPELASAARRLSGQTVPRGSFGHQTPSGETPADRLRRAGRLPERGRTAAAEFGRR